MTCTRQSTADGAFDTVAETTVAALEDEGFGVLCDNDEQAVEGGAVA